jgi:hypothetical protein
LRTVDAGVLKIGGIAISDDGVRDDLFGDEPFGAKGLDWFVGGAQDVLHDRRPNEQVN